MPGESSDEQALRAGIVVPATWLRFYGYRRVAALLSRMGWHVNHKHVERLWRADRLTLRLRAEHLNHVWACDFVFDRTVDGRKLRMLTWVDEHTRERLAIEVARRFTSQEVLTRACRPIRPARPPYIRSHTGPEFAALAVRWWLGRIDGRRASATRGVPGSRATSSPSTAVCTTRNLNGERCARWAPRRWRPKREEALTGSDAALEPLHGVSHALGE